MSMTETPSPAAPKPKRKYAARRQRPAAPRAAAKPDEFAGITTVACCTACDATRCVISGRPYCAHPYKGGLQGTDLHNAAATNRLNAAKKMLGKKKIVLGDHA